MSGAPGGPGRLAVLVDGEPLPDEEARAFWGRFSDYMEAHRGDLKGFAQQEGFASVHPAMQSGRAVLEASRSAAQKAYVTAPTIPDAGSGAGGKKPAGASAAKTKGGSQGHQGAPRRGPVTNGAPPKSRKK